MDPVYDYYRYNPDLISVWCLETGDNTKHFLCFFKWLLPILFESYYSRIYEICSEGMSRYHKRKKLLPAFLNISIMK